MEVACKRPHLARYGRWGGRDIQMTGELTESTLVGGGTGGSGYKRFAREKIVSLKSTEERNGMEPTLLCIITISWLGRPTRARLCPLTPRREPETEDG